MSNQEHKAGRPKGRRAKPFSTSLAPEERQYLEDLAAEWDMPQNRVISRLLRFAKFGEPLPKGQGNAT